MSEENDDFIMSRVLKNAAERERQRKAVDTQIAQPELLKAIRTCMSNSQRTTSIIDWLTLVVALVILIVTILK